MDYEPRPIDTPQITLTPQILQLMGVLARNAHDIWARQWFADGWRYSPRRDDRRKEHPCPVPYAQWPESRQQYDRHAAMETL